MSPAIGDSIRRRHGAPRPPAGSGSRVRWGRIALYGGAGALLAFGLGYLLAVFVLFPAPAAAAAGLVVPRLLGVDTSFAARTLALKGLRLGAVAMIPDPASPAGMIVAQDALAGQQLRRGAAVNVAVSSGPVRAVLPNVAGYTAARATAFLGALGFQVTQQTSPGNAPVGQVLRVEPEAGLSYDVPTQVLLVVSNGPPPPDSAAVADSAAVVDSAGAAPAPAPLPPGARGP